MPYKIVKTTNGKFFVENQQTGHRFSKSGLTKTNAEKQLKAIVVSQMKRGTH